MNEYTKVGWQDGTVLQPAKVTIDGTDYDVTPAVESGTTPVNATNLDKMDTALKQAHDSARSMEINKIDKATIELLTVDSTAPEHCSEGDMYYNTTTNYIYTATGTDTWGSTGALPSSKYLYVDLSNSKLYYYDGTNFTSYGGGASNDVIISDTQPTDNDWKIWIDNTETTDNTYYNDNGTATPFKTTTFDTLPVGAEVDYDGNTVPTGWTEVSDIDIGTIVNLFGNVGGSSVGTFDLYSHIVATKINYNTWKFEIQGQMDISNATHQYNWGIMPSKISDLLNSAIGKQVGFSETIRTLGTWEAYSSSTKLPNLDKYGYGTVFEYNGNAYLLPGRYYQTSGPIGGWALDNFENGSFMKATVYLKEV